MGVEDVRTTVCGAKDRFRRRGKRLLTSTRKGCVGLGFVSRVLVKCKANERSEFAIVLIGLRGSKNKAGWKIIRSRKIAKLM